MNVRNILTLVHIESVGIYTASDLFYRSIEVLKNKSNSWKEILDEKVKNSK